MPTRLPLTSAQKVAATSSASRVYIEAPPGSGKTTVATERFGVARFGEPTGKRGVLALSFARSARGELRDRVRRRWGSNALRWPNHIWTLDRLHTTIVEHLLGSGALGWPGGHTKLEVIDSWRCHPGSRWLNSTQYRRSLLIDGGEVKISNTILGPDGHAFTQIDPYRTQIEAGRCTHLEVRAVLAAAIAPGSPLRPVVGEYLTETISALIVDEVFDGNSLDLRIVGGAARRKIPTTLIGDPWQALYKFRGAEPHLVPTLIQELSFDPHPIDESFRFESTEMQDLAAQLRAGQPASLSAGSASDCDMVLACEWSRLWECSDDVLPYSFGQPSNRVDAAIAILLDQIVARRFEPLSTFVHDAAAILRIDVDLLRQESSAHFAPVIERLAAGTAEDADAALAMLRTALIEMGSLNITNLSAARMAERRASLVGLAKRLDRPHLTPGLTVHQAKGREWPHVGVVLAADELQRLAAGLSPVNEDDRTVYVALTRARSSTSLVG